MHHPTVIHALLAHAADAPGALAFGFGEAHLSAGELARDVERMATGLVARGLQRGERVALVLPTGADFVRTLFGAQRAGLVPVAINPSVPRELIMRRAALVRAGLVVETDTVAGLLAAGSGPPPPLAVGPDDLAFMQITSGTTGEPRAAMISHANLVAYIEASREPLGLRPDDVFSSFVPLHHDLGLVRFVLAPVHLGCPSHLVPPSVAGLREWLATITRVRATLTSAPDFAYRIAARTVAPAGLDLRSLRMAGNGGEPARQTTIEAFEARFGLSGVVQPGYGLAEATLVVASARAGDPLLTDARGALSCGRPHPGLEVRLADNGEILARGPSIFRGYFDDDEATRASLRDGWLHTGDVGGFDAAGNLYVHGRERALIKRGGALVAPREVEEAVDLLPGVKLSAAIGVGRPANGSEDLVVIVEVGEDPVTIGAVADAVTAAIGFAPGEVVLVPPRTIPRTASGKIQHAELRRRFLGGEVRGRS